MAVMVVVVVVVLDGLQWLSSVVVVVDDYSGCDWRLWWRVAVVVVYVVVEMVSGDGGGDVRMVVQIVSGDGSGIRWLWWLWL